MSRPLQLGAVAVVATALVVAGRYESARAADTQTDGMRHVVALVGARWARGATYYRLTPAFDCLLYRHRGDAYGLELCFAADGRVVEGIDRSSSPTRFWTLQFDPGASGLRFDPARVAAAFVAAGAAPAGSTTIPLDHWDTSPVKVKSK